MCSDEERHGVSALTTEILAVLATFASEFSRPTWKNIQINLIGAILCRGPRRIKSELTFSDIIAIVRRSIWSNKYFSKSENQLDFEKCSKEGIHSLIYQLTLAA